MGISDIWRWVVAVLKQEDPYWDDGILDGWIQDALWEEAIGQTPVMTWERMRQTVLQRGSRYKHGMWVLDEINGQGAYPRTLVVRPALVQETARDKKARRSGFFGPSRQLFSFTLMDLTPTLLVLGRL